MENSTFEAGGKRRDICCVRFVLIRHGESEANATHSHVPDPTLTALGRAQASEWAPVTSKWVALLSQKKTVRQLEDAAGDRSSSAFTYPPSYRMRVLVSPLFRTLETAALAFSPTIMALTASDTSSAGGTQEASHHDGVNFIVAVEARELWWNHVDNRGLASSRNTLEGQDKEGSSRNSDDSTNNFLKRLQSQKRDTGTALLTRELKSSGGIDDENDSAPRLVLGGLDELSRPSRHWDPYGEATAGKKELNRRSRAAVTAFVSRLCSEAERVCAAWSPAAAALSPEPADYPDVVVICHYGIIQQIADVSVDNCEAVVLNFTRMNDDEISPDAHVVSLKEGAQISDGGSSLPRKKNRCLCEARRLGWTFSLAKRGKPSNFLNMPLPSLLPSVAVAVTPKKSLSKVAKGESRSSNIGTFASSSTDSGNRSRNSKNRRERRRLALEKLAKLFGKDVGDIESVSSESMSLTSNDEAISQDDHLGSSVRNNPKALRARLLRIAQEPAVALAMVNGSGGNGTSTTVALDRVFWKAQVSPMTFDAQDNQTAQSPCRRSSRPSFFDAGVDSREELLHELDEIGFSAVSRSMAAVTSTSLPSSLSGSRKSQPAAREEGRKDEKTEESGVFVERMAEMVENLVSRGWPPVFVFLLDEPWQLLQALRENVALHVLGSDCVLEPTVFAWHSAPLHSVSTSTTSSKPTNFSLPHRDYSFEESHRTGIKDSSSAAELSTGARFAGRRGRTSTSTIAVECGEVLEPTILCAWVPLTDADVRSGCLTMVPKEFDHCFHCENSESHLRAATRPSSGNGGDSGLENGRNKWKKKESSFRDRKRGKQRQKKNLGYDESHDNTKDTGIVEAELRFDVAAARAVPLQAGSALVWRGNVIHWGGRCGCDAPRPRISLGATFRAKTAQQGAEFTGSTCINLPSAATASPRAEFLSLQERLSLVCRSIVLYSQWLPLEASLFPDVFHRAAQSATLRDANAT